MNTKIKINWIMNGFAFVCVALLSGCPRTFAAGPEVQISQINSSWLQWDAFQALSIAEEYKKRNRLVSVSPYVDLRVHHSARERVQHRIYSQMRKSLAGQNYESADQTEQSERYRDLNVVPVYDISDRERVLRPDLGLSFVDLRTALVHRDVDETLLSAKGVVPGLGNAPLEAYHSQLSIESYMWFLNSFEKVALTLSKNELAQIYKNSSLILEKASQFQEHEKAVMIELAGEVHKFAGSQTLAEIFGLRGLQKVKLWIEGGSLLKMKQTQFGSLEKAEQIKEVRANLISLAHAYDINNVTIHLNLPKESSKALHSVIAQAERSLEVFHIPEENFRIRTLINRASTHVQVIACSQVFVN